MRNILIEIEYDGTNYCGWQVQSNGKTIQEEIMKSLIKLTGKKINVNGAGRTDARVHAKGQRANFIIDSSIPTNRIPVAMNGILPPDIAVIKAEEVPMDFHARYSAVGKRYSYQIYNYPVRSPLLRNYAWHIQSSLDPDIMQKASEIFIGTHDFAAFTAAGSQVKTTVRSIYKIQIKKIADSICITYDGNGFLYKMVRIMTAAIVEAGLKKLSLEDLSKILQSGDINRDKKTAPPQGLFLDKVYYSLL